MTGPEAYFQRLTGIALDAARCDAAIATALDDLPGRLHYIAVGKAAAAMAAAAEAARRFATGLAIVPPATPPGALSVGRVIVGAHPVPDARSHAAGAAALALAASLDADDTLVLLVSGGASAMMEALRPDVSVEAHAALTRALLSAGMPIGEMNVVRSACSQVKAGGLAIAAWPARTVSLVLSDVPGDALASVGSGPGLAPLVDPQGAAIDIARRYALCLPWSAVPVAAHHPALAAASGRLVGSPAAVLAAVEAQLDRDGFHVIALGPDVQGDATELGRRHAAQVLDHAARAARPVAILSGGETTTRVRSAARGGRNKAYLLAAALACEGAPDCVGMAIDTDGIDGTSDDAGAWFDRSTLAKSRAAGIDPAASLATSNALAVFEAAGSLIVTGPTGTNVNDLRLLLSSMGRGAGRRTRLAFDRAAFPSDDAAGLGGLDARYSAGRSTG